MKGNACETAVLPDALVSARVNFFSFSPFSPPAGVGAASPFSVDWDIIDEVWLRGIVVRRTAYIDGQDRKNAQAGTCLTPRPG